MKGLVHLEGKSYPSRLLRKRAGRVLARLVPPLHQILQLNVDAEGSCD